MNRYILIRRLRGPAFLLLVGIMALLRQAHILFWWQSWPLLLILAGVLLLAERAALAADGYPQYPGTNWQGAPQRGAWQETSPSGAGSAQQTTETSIVPPEPHDFGDHESGAQS
ncbi:MAG: DUF5668 domain-containing protein [Terracidiphilus sp.]|jgi:hypothetical protein